jgi:hypothetical protein
MYFFKVFMFSPSKFKLSSLCAAFNFNFSGFIGYPYLRILKRSLIALAKNCCIPRDDVGMLEIRPSGSPIL